MRVRPWSPAIHVPPPTPVLLAFVTLAFVSCELARGVADAAPACPDAAPVAPASDARSDARSDTTSDATSDASEVTIEDASGEPARAPVALRGPAIASVLKAAYRAAGLDRDPGRGWVRRARLAGLIPWLTVRTGRDTSWQSDEVAVDHGMVFDIRATWRLDRLLFDGRELQVASAEAARRRERRRLASQVIRLYFAWQRAVARGGGAGYRAGTRSTPARALEAAAELDALTDGWFSESLVGPRRSASETRTR